MPSTVVARAPIKSGGRLCTVAVATFKNQTYRYLRLERPTDEQLQAGVIISADMSTSRKGRLPVGEAARGQAAGDGQDKRSFSRLEWQELRERNEALDCRIAPAAAWIAGLTGGQTQHGELERRVGTPEASENAARGAGGPQVTIAGILPPRPEGTAGAYFRRAT